jgi:hypothetical protein
MVSHLFPAVDIGMTALSVAAAINLGAIIPQVEIKMAPTITAVATINETHHSVLSTPPSKFHPRENESKGDESKDGHRCCEKWW